MSPRQVGTSVDDALWFTVRGATLTIPLLWTAWLAFVAIATWPLVERLGAAGTTLVIAALGWCMARHLPSPIEWLRRYHVDDTEVTAMGPGAAVRRLAWSRVHTLTQERHTLRVAGDGVVMRLPYRPLVLRGAWGTMLARVVPALADELWTLLEEGEQVRLAPSPEPATATLAWWMWAPMAVSAAVVPDWGGLAVAAGLALCERAVATGRARSGAITLHRTGVAIRRRVRALFAAWPRAEVVSDPDGLVVGVAQGEAGRVRTALPNFWAAAAVIQMKAQLGVRANATVHFRARLGEDGFAVVGEVEPSA
jgi:hypothetical protein